MSFFDTLPEIRKVPWDSLRTGMIIVSGLTVNGELPRPLIDYPILNSEILSYLDKTFVIKPRIVSVIEGSLVPKNFGMKLRDEIVRLQRIQKFSMDYMTLKKTILLKSYGSTDFLIPAYKNPILIKPDTLILNRFSTLKEHSSPDGEPQNLPSIFRMTQKPLSMSDLFNKEVMESCHLPEDSPGMLHVAVDFSFSMKDKMAYVIEAVNSLCQFIKSGFPKTKFLVYAFSDDCRVVQPPIGKNIVSMKETSYGSFIRKVLHNRDKTIPNKIILLTDGRPSDHQDAVKYMGNFEKQQIDYCQIVFKNVHDRYTKRTDLPIVDGTVESTDFLPETEFTEKEKKDIEEREKVLFTDLADKANGNQVMLAYNEILQFVLVEYWDRYMGIRTVLKNQYS